MQGQKALIFHQKYLNLCSKNEWRSCRFGMERRWVINDRMFIFGGAISLSLASCEMAPLWIRFVGPAHPIDAQSDSGEFGAQSNTLNSLSCSSFRNSFCSVAGALCWKRALSSGNTTAMKWCTWSATMFRSVVRVKVTFSWMPGPKVSQQNIAQSIRLPLPTCFSSHSASCCHVFFRQAPQTLPAILLI